MKKHKFAAEMRGIEGDYYSFPLWHFLLEYEEKEKASLCLNCALQNECDVVKCWEAIRERHEKAISHVVYRCRFYETP